MKRLGIATMTLAAALAVAVPSLSPAAKGPTYAPKQCTKPRIEPRTIVIACGDGNFYVKVKRWNYWNAREAGGKGKAFANDCIPYCAAGSFHKYRVKVRLTKPRKRTCGGEKGVRLFQKIKIDWRGGKPSGAGGKYDLWCVP